MVGDLRPVTRDLPDGCADGLSVVMDVAPPATAPSWLLRSGNEVVARAHRLDGLSQPLLAWTEHGSARTDGRLHGTFLVRKGTAVIMQSHMRGFVLDDPAPWATAGFGLLPTPSLEWNVLDGSLAGSGGQLEARLSLFAVGAPVPSGARGLILLVASFLPGTPTGAQVTQLARFAEADPPGVVALGSTHDAPTRLARRLDEAA